MSTNCIKCVVNRRTGGDLLCDECRATEPSQRKHLFDGEEGEGAPFKVLRVMGGERPVVAKPASRLKGASPEFIRELAAKSAQRLKDGLELPEI